MEAHYGRSIALLDQLDKKVGLYIYFLKLFKNKPFIQFMDKYYNKNVVITI